MKKKGKITIIITVGLACFVLTMVMFMQFKIVNETDITSIETMREEELRTELANWRAKYEEANSQYEEKSQKLEEYKQKEESDAESAELVQKELEQVNMSLGKTKVQGEGIVITLRDKQEEDFAQINADDLLQIVNDLKEAGAEAISINDERIINMSDIVFVSNSVIKVNQHRILAPYIIKAIGNQTYLEGALLGNGGYVDKLNKLGYDVTTVKDNKVVIEPYSGNIEIKYIEQ